MHRTCRILASTVTLLVVTAGRAAMFDGIRVYPVGSSPSSSAVGDFNGDGAPDVAVSRATFSGNTLTVLLGDGNGGFLSPGASYVTGTGGAQVAIADVDDDGVQDLLVANTYSDNVTVLLGAGDGTFVELGRYATADYPVKMALGDFNADGLTDVVVTSRNTDSISLLLGTGGGALGPYTSYSVGDQPEPVAAGDLDGDGDDDIVVGAGDFQERTLSVLLSSGDGTFTPGVVIEDVESPHGLVLNDLNEDGYLDLVVGESGVSSIAVWRGLGGGAFGSRTRYPASYGVAAIDAYDLDHDGHKDLIVGASDVSIYFGFPGAGFGGHADFAVGGGPAGVAVCQADGDGVEDIVAVASGAAVVLKGYGNREFATPARYAIGSGSQPGSIASGDIDSDGDIDLMTSNRTGDDLSVLLGDGDGAFAWRQPDIPANDGPSNIRLQDVTADGALDCLVADNGWKVRSYVGAVNGTFSATGLCDVYSGLTPPAICDINEDGHLDLAVGYGYDPYWHNLTTGIAILLGDGAGRFDWVFGLDCVKYPSRVVAGDLNGDGHQDLVMLGSSHSRAYLYIGHGDGTFDPAAPFAEGLYPVSVQAADLNADGTPDLLMGSSTENSVLFLPGVGDGTFGQPVVTPNVGTTPINIVLGDFDCDGVADIAVSGSVLYVLRGLGGGTFGDRECYMGGSPLTAADFDSDGDLDLALVNSSEDKVTVLLGRGSETPVEGALYGVVTESGAVLLRWSLGSLSGARWLHVYRATAADGPFTRLNVEPLGPLAVGSYEDSTVWPGETFWYELRAEHWDESEAPVAAGQAMVRTPGELATRLFPPMPNPSSAGLRLQMDIAANAARGRLVVYDVAGREVRVLLDGSVEHGRRWVSWDCRDASGNDVAAGAYFARLSTPEQTATCKIAVVR